MMNPQPLILHGTLVRLEPLQRNHIQGLAKAGSDPGIWKFMRYGLVTTPETMSIWVETLLDAQIKGHELPFTVFWQATGQVIGATRYMNISRENRSLEIGGTWYTPKFQRTGANTESKYLLIRHAFEYLGCIRVQFKTDFLNQRSQTAIERLGAVREGVLRNHMILPDGRVRDSVYFSIISSEWAGVKSRLEGLLTRDTISG